MKTIKHWLEFLWIVALMVLHWLVVAVAFGVLIGALGGIAFLIGKWIVGLFS
jgi:hypothetical protein